MRQVLFRIPWDGLPLGGGKLPLFGLGVFLLAWIVFGMWALVEQRRQTGRWLPAEPVGAILWLVAAVALLCAPDFGPKIAPLGVPLFGYASMLLTGLISAIWLAERRAKWSGFDPEMIWDLATWLFIPGIVGARIFYLVQYREQVFAGKQGLWPVLAAAVNLTEGGIVLYGALIAGALAFFGYCALKNLPPLVLADIITPSIFVGIGFGRLGCLLNGCCFGDACDMPWAVVFPKFVEADRFSVPFSMLLQRGFLSPDSPCTPPLHPTQIYSAIDGFVIAGLTLWYHRYRRIPGDVFGLGMLLAPITRFLIEFVRGDEYGQFGTSLTISQVISVFLFVLAVSFQAYLHHRATRLPAGAPVKPPAMLATS